MNKEYRKRLFALMDEIDDLAKMGIHLEKEEVTGEVEMLQEPEKAQPKIDVMQGVLIFWIRVYVQLWTSEVRTAK